MVQNIIFIKRDKHSKWHRFFKHQATNLDSALLYQNDIEKMGWQNTEIANQKITEILAGDTNDDSKWEHIMRVPMKYNRLLLLRPWLWHTAGPGFGDSFENGRFNIFVILWNV